MAKISFSEAAKKGWASRPTLYRKWKSGQLAAEKSEDSGALVDVSELVRVFGEPKRRGLKHVGGQSVTGSVSSAVTDEAETEVERLKAELAAARAEADQARADLDRERQALDRERQNADRLLALLEQSQRQITDQSSSPRPGLLGRLFGRRK